MTEKLIKIFALALLALFFLPYIIKIKQWDLVFLLLAGLALPIYDLLITRNPKKND